MSEKTSEKEWFEWWQGAKRRAYTYKEKKLNQSSDYEFYCEKFGQEISMDKLSAWCVSENYKIAGYRLKEMKKTIEERGNREDFDKGVETGEGFFEFMVSLRNEMPHGFTNAEIYVVGVNYMLRLVDLGREAEGPITITEDADYDLCIDVIKDVHANWGYYLDTIKQAEERFKRWLLSRMEAHGENPSRSVIIAPKEP